MRRLIPGALFMMLYDGCPAGEAPDSGIPVSWHRWRTDGIVEGAQHPFALVIHSTQQLLSYYEDHKDSYRLDGFAKDLARYDRAYFEDQLLILVRLQETSGATGHEVIGLNHTIGGLVVWIERSVPGLGTADMAQYHMVIECPKAHDTDGPVRVRLTRAQTAEEA